MEATIDRRQQRLKRAARITVRCGALLAVALSLAACDKCGRATPINKPWSSACESGPSTN
ncbi:hypothetical protein GCM10019059_29900 [Camelimonas fluminis]|uniref:Peptidylprolyl isomerase n=1 Tax=Camelimonas fluminis TaxID=1576911 RepID=A0ABV7UJU8_9HYPH|nr:hypothetical protein [Camelimonas fluminis]GHE68063.1 hypothetical protein GCM10019059_29900 [Camelimonas fluminis]